MESEAEGWGLKCVFFHDRHWESRFWRGLHLTPLVYFVLFLSISVPSRRA